MTVMVMMAVVMMMMPMVIAPRGQPRPPRESRGGCKSNFANECGQEF